MSRVLMALAASCLVCAGAVGARALGAGTRVEVRGVQVGDLPEPRESARRRLAWEVRKRTSIETVLRPSRSRLDDPAIFESPLLYWAGDRAFPPLSEGEIIGLRRFVEFGGFVLVDDATPTSDGFDQSVRRALRRAFPDDRLAPLPRDHTVYRSFFLLDRPYGRIRGPETLLGLQRGDRVAIVYSRHDLGGAWARDNLGTWEHSVVPGGDRQRELAIRLGVNLVMYALCLDYKDDQVHAPFIMRRRGGGGR
ncbi:MAG TPA: DUF4159 domain-containing protein [Polyangiaceae bacterium LLY-WYZ-15_(1-7)]|nr:DUF4159 domain-containing protein [Polyangiaceae bacterium LLY-WYZ-15_(1-7)]HJL08218.1 DUF4159 domain-containing protein [Polyangiaceae bacterium LLY-WYZ-15_(1-7)]